MRPELTKEQVWFDRGVVVLLALIFVLVCAGLVRTMHANDAQFSPTPTTVRR